MPEENHKPCDYGPEEKLFRSYRLSDLNVNGEIEFNSIRFPDFSCNWSRYADAESVKYRDKGKNTDGCYSFPVAAAQYNKMATPCHNPLENNFSHTDVRQLGVNEPIDFEPPMSRKKLESNNWNSASKALYRQNIINNKEIQFKPDV